MFGLNCLLCFINDRDGRRDSAPSLFSSPNHHPLAHSTNGNEPLPPRPPPSLASWSWSDQHKYPGPGNGNGHGPPHHGDSVGPLHPIPPNYPPDRRMSVPDAMAPIRSRSSRAPSRPPSRQEPHSSHSQAASVGTDGSSPEDNPSGPSASAGKGSKDGNTPYSRSPELRQSHKLAERKRRKEMKELFEDLHNHLPSDRGMKASKWEILTKTIEYVSQLKAREQALSAENEILRRDNESMRQGGIPNFGPGGPPHGMPFGQAPFPPSLQAALGPPISASTHQSSVNQLVTPNGHRTDSS